MLVNALQITSFCSVLWYFSKQLVKLALQFPQPIFEIWKRNWEYSQQTIGNGVLESHLKSTIMAMVVEVKCESLIRIA